VAEGCGFTLTNNPGEFEFSYGATNAVNQIVEELHPALDPANRRMSIEFFDSSGRLRGATSVAVEGSP